MWLDFVRAGEYVSETGAPNSTEQRTRVAGTAQTLRRVRDLRSYIPAAFPAFRSRRLRYGLALLFVGAALGLSLLLRPFIYASPFLLFYPITTLSIWLCGPGPGLLATALSAVAVDYFFLPPVNTFNADPATISRLAIYAAISVLVIWLTRSTRHAQSLLDVYLGLLEISFHPVIMHDEHGRIVYWNHGAERLYGWTSAEAVGQAEHDLLQTLLPEPLERIQEKLRRDGEWEGEVTQITKDQRRVIVVSHRTLRRDRRKQRLLEANFDVTERKAMEEAMRTVFNSVYDGIILHAIDGAILDVNDRCLAMYGISREDLPRLTIASMSSASNPLAGLPSLWQKVIAGEPRLFEWRARRPWDGSEFDVEVHLRPIHVHGLDVILASIRDITSRKQSQEALLNSEKLAATGRMAASMAHEINNPLEIVSSAVYLAATDPSIPESARSKLDIAERELERVAHLVRQTLGFYRETTSPAVFGLSNTIGDILELYAPKLKAKRAEIVADCSPDDRVYAILGEVRQILSNLLTNAVDAIPVGGRIVIRTKRLNALASSPPVVRFTIADNGGGIDPKNQPRVFEPFFTTKQSVGTGLGLWVTRELVMKQEGAIRFRSRRNAGTVFSVYFPAADSDSQTAGMKS